MTDTRVRAPSPPTTITESVGTAAPPREGRMLVQIITPGTGSSGVYPAEVLEAAAGARVFRAGLHLYADHPSLTEAQDRPERSIRDLAGVLTQDAYWNGTALVAEAKTYAPWSDVLAQMHEDIGVSIRASARVEESDEQGRPIIAELVEALSVDFVTRAGRGGKVLKVLESARQVQETLPGGLVADDLEQRLDDALGPDSWVQDFTDEWLVYRTWDGGDERVLLQRSYTSDEQGRITLTGTPTRVSRRVTYDATTGPDSPATIPPSSLAGVAMESHQKEEEPLMAQIQVDEAEHKRLTEAAAQVATIEAERDAARHELEEARKAAADARKVAESATVSRILSEAGVQFSKWERAGIESALPRTEDDALDEAAFTERVKEAATEKAAESGHGRPTGFGSVAESTTDISEADLDGLLGIQKGA